MEGPANFDPFLDWEKITQEQAEKLREAVVRHRESVEALVSDPNPVNAADSLKAHIFLSTVATDVEESIYTVPAMVHIAGPVTEEHDDQHDVEETIQRCARCGSMLNRWSDSLMALTPAGPQRIDREDIPWLNEGMRVAKADYGSHYDFYSIDNRQLESHEYECVDLAGLDGGLHGD